MADLDPLADEQGPKNELRRLGWGLLVYALVLLGMGIGVLRLAVTHRRFGGLTVVHLPVPVRDSAASGAPAADTAPAVQFAADSSDTPVAAESLPGAQPVSGAVP